MRSHAGVASTIFKALADKKINIQMISTSEIKVSVVIDEKHLELGVRTLHMAFGLGTECAFIIDWMKSLFLIQGQNLMANS